MAGHVFRKIRQGLLEAIAYEQKTTASSNSGGGREEEQMQNIENTRRKLRQQWNTYKRDHWIRETRKGFDETEYILRWYNEFCASIGVNRSDLNSTVKRKLFEVATIEYRNQKKILKWRKRKALPPVVQLHTVSEKPAVGIQCFCAELATLWQYCPEMRFGQLVVNALGSDPFYMEDSEALKRIKNFTSTQQK